MDIGYINLDTAQRNKVLGMLQKLKEQGAVDELGIGRVRDAFADLMFPGTSTLQKHAKYFTVLPHLYKEAVKYSYNTPREVYKKIIEMEIQLTKQLVEGSPANTSGITGSDIVRYNKGEVSKYVKYDPSYIYMSGMRTFEIVKGDALYKLIKAMSKKFHEQPNRYVSDEEGNSDDAILKGCTDFCISPQKTKYNSVAPINISLTYNEAEFLKRQIITAKKSRDSLLAYILKNNYPMTENFFDFNPTNLPENLKNYYLRAKEFSLFLRGLYLRYNYIFSHSSKDGGDEGLRISFEKHIADFSNIYTPITLDGIFGLIRLHISDNSIESFCNQALNAIAKGGDDNYSQLDNLIVGREQAVKGISRSKLRKPEKYPYMPVHLYDNTFRWEISYTIIKEIKEGLENGRTII